MQDITNDHNTGDTLEEDLKSYTKKKMEISVELLSHLKRLEVLQKQIFSFIEPSKEGIEPKDYAILVAASKASFKLLKTEETNISTSLTELRLKKETTQATIDLLVEMTASNQQGNLFCANVALHTKFDAGLSNSSLSRNVTYRHPHHINTNILLEGGYAPSAVGHASHLDTPVRDPVSVPRGTKAAHNTFSTPASYVTYRERGNVNDVYPALFNNVNHGSRTNGSGGVEINNRVKKNLKTDHSFNGQKSSNTINELNDSKNNEISKYHEHSFTIVPDTNRNLTNTLNLSKDLLLYEEEHDIDNIHFKDDNLFIIVGKKRALEKNNSSNLLGLVTISKSAILGKDEKLKADTTLNHFEKLRSLSTQAVEKVFGKHYEKQDLKAALEFFVDKSFSRAFEVMNECSTVQDFWDRIAETFYDHWYSKDHLFHTYFVELFNTLTVPRSHTDHVAIFERLTKFRNIHLRTLGASELEGQSEDFIAGYEKALQHLSEFEIRDVIFTTAGKGNLELIASKVKPNFSECDVGELKKKLNELIVEENRDTHGYRMVYSKGNRDKVMNIAPKKVMKDKSEKEKKQIVQSGNTKMKTKTSSAPTTTSFTPPPSNKPFCNTCKKHHWNECNPNYISLSRPPVQQSNSRPPFQQSYSQPSFQQQRNGTEHGILRNQPIRYDNNNHNNNNNNNNNHGGKRASGNTSTSVNNQNKKVRIGSYTETLNFAFTNTPIDYGYDNLSKTDKPKKNFALRESSVKSLDKVAQNIIRLRELNGDKDRSASETVNINNVDTSEDGNKRSKGYPQTSHLIPGGGRKTLVVFTCRDGERITAWIDSGSTTTLVTANYIKRMRLQTYEINSVVDFQGLFGTKKERNPKCCLITLSSQNFLDLSFPAYVVDSLASGADILIGTDQLGKSIKLELGFDESLIVSVKDKRGNVIDYVVRDRLGASPRSSTSNNTFLSSADSKVSNTQKLIENNNYLEPSSKEMSNDMNMSNHLERESSSHTLQYESGHTSFFEPVFLFSGDEDSHQIELIMRRGKLMSELKETQQALAIDVETPKFDKRNSRKIFKSTKMEFVQQLGERERIITDCIKRVDTEYHQYQLQQKLKTQKKRLELKSTNHTVNDYSHLEGNENQGLSKKERGRIHNTMKEEINFSSKEEAKRYFEQEFNHLNKEDEPEPEVTNLITAEAIKTAEQPLESEWDEPIWDAVEEKKKYIPHTLRVNEQAQVEALLQSKKDTLVGKDEKIEMGKATLPNGTRLEFDVVITNEGQLKLSSKSTSKPYKMKKPLLDLLKQTINDMELQGVGQMSSTTWSAEFASPAFFVVKKGKARFCVNFTELNNMTVNDVYPIPDIENILEEFHGKKYFSIIDLKSGYHQFPLSENAKKYAACITPEGIFRYDCLTFGFKNAPAFFQRFMNNSFGDYISKFVRIYIDDIVIFSDDFVSHLKHVELVLNRLKECHIKANKDKCHFFLKEMRVLGKIIAEEGIKPDPDLIKAMLEFPTPNSKTKIRGFLALCSHYRHFVKDFYKFASVLNPLTKLDCVWNNETWNSKKEYEDTFVALKKEMTTVGENTVLAYPNWNEIFHIQSDACLKGAGAILFQLDEDKRKHVVAYASWNFSDQQKHYTTTERELLGFLFAVRKWKAFLWGRRFEAETDHQPLTGTLRLEDPHGRIARWSAELAQYDFKLKYLPGKDNIPADVLSRVFDETINHLECYFVDDINNDLKEEVILKIVMERLEKEAGMRTSKVLIESYDKFWGEEEIEEDYLVEETTLGFIDYRLPSNEEWAKAQLEDKEFKDTYIYLEKGILPEDPNDKRTTRNEAQYFTLDNTTKLLMRNTKIRPTDPDNSLRICLPKKYFSIMTILYHDSVWAGGHQGVEKTLDKISERFYHKSLRTFVKTWTRTCDICNRNKRVHPIGSLNKHEVGNLQFVKQPWELVCIDVWEPGVVSDMNNTAVLTVIDVFSRFAWAIPMSNMEASTIAYALYSHVFSHFPLPQRIHSDRGKNLIGKVMTQLKELFHIDSSATTSYHPEGNSIAERIHQFFRNALTAYINEDQTDWDLFLPAVMRIYLDAAHNGLGNLYSPSEIVFGRRLGYTSKEVVEKGCEDEKEFVERLRLALNRAASLVIKDLEQRKRKKIELKEKRDQILLDNKLHRWVRKTRQKPFKVGDRVGLRVEKVGEEFESKKLFPRFQGPYTIASISKEGKVIYLHNPYTGKEEISPVPVTRIIDFPLRKDVGEIDMDVENGDDIYEKVVIDDLSDESVEVVPEEAESIPVNRSPDIPAPVVPLGRHSLRKAMERVVNQRIEVFWPKKNTWYPGTVVGLSHKSNIEEGNKKDIGTHDILYDDERKARNYLPISEKLFGEDAEKWRYL